MTPDEFKARTKQFTLRVFKLCAALPRTRVAEVVARQLLRSGSSVGANYRAACRAYSTRVMRAKLGFVEEEADESLFWMELIVDDGMMPAKRVDPLKKEGSEILAMVVASIRTLRERLKRGGKKNE